MLDVKTMMVLRKSTLLPGVGDLALVEDLEEHVEHSGVRLLDLIEEDDRVGLAADLLGEFSAGS